MSRSASEREEPSTSASSLEEALAHVADSYPHNHDYRLRRGELRPGLKLWWRWRRIRALYPPRLESLLDLSSSKGFFVLEAARRPGCARALGIDVHAPDLAAARLLAAHLGAERARFVHLRLDDLAARIGDFGGPFQTVLLLNTYPYLFFGSRREPRGWDDHELLFEFLAAVTGERLIFGNRVEVDRLPPHLRAIARSRGPGPRYDEASIQAAAQAHFALTRRGRLGRIPLWLLHKREAALVATSSPPARAPGPSP